MTVESAYSPASYNGNDVTTEFPTTWRFLDDAHLVVTKTTAAVDTVLALGADYSVDGAGDPEPGGSVTLAIALPSGSSLTIERSTPIVQPNAFRQLGTFSPDTWERTVDRITLWGEELAYRLGVLEALSSLVNVATLAAGTRYSGDFTTDANSVEATFPFNIAVANGQNAVDALQRVFVKADPSARFDTTPLVQWKPGALANTITILGVDGLAVGTQYTLKMMFLF